MAFLREEELHWVSGFRGGSICRVRSLAILSKRKRPHDGIRCF